MNRYTVVLLMLAVITLVAFTPVRAQEWSAAQKEVWKNVEAYWALDAAGNLEGFLSYFHNNYIGWENQSALPWDKSAVRKFLDHSYKTQTTILYDIKPVAINVFGDFAFADYYYTWVYKDVEGKEKTDSGRWTDILMRQGDKWVLIGDHGGKTSKD